MLKNLLGICSCERCFRRGIHELKFDGVHKVTGKPKTIKFKLCHEHTMKFMEECNPEIKSISII